MGVRSLPAPGSAGLVLERLHRRFARLSRDVDEDEVPPTRAAQSACEGVLASLSMRLPAGFPFPHVSTAGQGDLFCEWRGERATVLVFISSSGTVALHRIGTRSGQRQATPSATPDEVAEAIEWFEASNTPR